MEVLRIQDLKATVCMVGEILNWDIRKDNKNNGGNRDWVEVDNFL